MHLGARRSVPVSGRILHIAVAVVWRVLIVGELLVLAGGVGNGRDV